MHPWEVVYDFYAGMLRANRSSHSQKSGIALVLAVLPTYGTAIKPKSDTTTEMRDIFILHNFWATFFYLRSVGS